MKNGQSITIPNFIFFYISFIFKVLKFSMLDRTILAYRKAFLKTKVLEFPWFYPQHHCLMTCSEFVLNAGELKQKIFGIEKAPLWCYP
jgi:hypothetical protein